MNAPEEQTVILPALTVLYNKLDKEVAPTAVLSE
jgi:hypothetical protein